jgi:hypothetical protein
MSVCIYIYIYIYVYIYVYISLYIYMCVCMNILFINWYLDVSTNSFVWYRINLLTLGKLSFEDLSGHERALYIIYSLSLYEMLN